MANEDRLVISVPGLKVYLLNPGEHFAGFGGHRAGLTVSRKTASLITVRETSGIVEYDEYDIYDKKAWSMILNRVERHNGEQRSDP